MKRTRTRLWKACVPEREAHKRVFGGGEMDKGLKSLKGGVAFFYFLALADIIGSALDAKTQRRKGRKGIPRIRNLNFAFFASSWLCVERDAADGEHR